MPIRIANDQIRSTNFGIRKVAWSYSRAYPIITTTLIPAKAIQKISSHAIFSNGMAITIKHGLYLNSHISITNAWVWKLTTTTKQRFNSQASLNAQLQLKNWHSYIAHSRAHFNYQLKLNHIVSYDDVYSAKYAPLRELINRFGAKELIQRSDRSPEHLAPSELLHAIAHNLDMMPLVVGESENVEAILVATFESAKIIKEQALAIDDFVDSYLRLDYKVDTITTENAPRILREIACNVVRWYLYQDGGLEDKHIIQRRYDDALDKLERIRTGHLNLDAPRVSIPIDTVPSSGIFFNTSRKHWGK